MNTHGPLHIEIFNDGMFQENGLLLWGDGGGDCWIIDPGLPPQPEQMTAAIRARGLQPTAIMLTHCHVDHIAGIGPLRHAFPQLPIFAPRGEEHMLTNAEGNLSEPFGFPLTAPAADGLLAPGQTRSLAELEWRLLDVSGHSPAGLAFYCPQVGVVIAGDALFAGSIGRYDLPGCSRTRLIQNIRDNLLSLPDETTLYSGHGPTSTIGHERRHNSILQAEFAELGE